VTFAEWITLYKYRALTDQALKELFIVLGKEDEDGKGNRVRVSDQKPARRTDGQH
jgi:hypothetical protein